MPLLLTSQPPMPELSGGGLGRGGVGGGGEEHTAQACKRMQMITFDHKQPLKQIVLCTLVTVNTCLQRA